MSNRKKRNLAIALVLSLLIIPLYFLSHKMEQEVARKEKKSTERRPAVQDASYLMLSE